MITLILLSVTLVMAIAFLAISRRERGSVSTTEDTTTAKFAADSALSRAEFRIVSQIEATTNPYVEGLVVSTNFINQNGFVPGFSSPTNVNYDHGFDNNTPLSAADFVQNIANLYYNPRPPVFYSNDFRFYLDLNRNGRYDTNGWVEDQNNFGTTNGLGTYSFEVGDPEWIGVLAHPDQPHGPNNPFIARYCFIAVPANSLDLNDIHNQAMDAGEAAVNAPVAGVDGYSRDQGVGSWEINLAAFLADLNTNRWDPPLDPYTYPEGAVAPNGFGASVAFDDARALVAWRYNNTYTPPSLDSADDLFGGPSGWGNFAFLGNGIDYYSRGQQYTLDTNFYNIAYAYGDPTAMSWLGAPLTNDFFSSPAELFNVNQSSMSFVTNLYSAGTNLSTYDRYTFYRMLGQIGTDTQPPSGKVNLNYQNAIVNYDTADTSRYPAAAAVPTSITIVPNMETNFLSWNPQDFFTVAADKLLRAYSTQWFEESPSNYIQTYYGIPYGYCYTNLDGMNVTNVQYYGQTNQIPSFGITNIPVYVNGSFVYSPAINRLLQLAANIYDASTNTSFGVDSNYPSVFRPIFYKNYEYNYFLRQGFTNVYIKGYQYVAYATNGISDPMFAGPVEVTDPRLPFGYSTTNVWGVPWIIGAKKGFPNLNQLEVENSLFIERELQMEKRTLDPATLFATNQMYIMAITNYFGANDWNSYAESYNNPVSIVARDNVSIGMTWTNDSNLPAVNNPGKSSSFINALFAYTNINVRPWSGQASVMMFGTNVYSYTLAIPGGAALEGGTFENALMNSSQPSFLSFVTNAAFIYYYGPNSRTFNSSLGTFTFNPPCFIPTFLDPSNYMDAGTPPLPQMTLWVTNHLQAYMIDSTGHILDYVQLGGMNNYMNVNQAVADNSRGYSDGLWSTNTIQGGTPQGVNEQILISQIGGTVPSEDVEGGGWVNTPVPGTTDTGSGAQQAYFSAFLSPRNYASYANAVGGYVTNYLTTMQVPYTATRTVVQRFVYAANDPLVHYMTQDLYDFVDSTNNFVLDDPPLQKLCALSDRYMPWGNGKWLAGSTFYNIPVGQYASEYDLRYRDPLVNGPDNWDFPTNKYPTVGWLGRVHRGTPWQTVYLKSPDILAQMGPPGVNVGLPTWQLWTGNVYNSYDAVNTAPDQDRLLFDLFTAAPDDDAMRGQLSINVGANDPNHDPLDGLASWSALLSGITVITNNQPDLDLGFNPPNPPYYGAWTVQPVGSPPYPGANIESNAMWQIVAGINSIRTNSILNTNTDGLADVFEHVGDILRVPQLSVASPFLNNDTAQQPAGINDEMYEWLPQQILGLLTVGGSPQNPPRYVVYCYGQTLKPAPNSFVSSGPYFGMCTNYQVTAESAARVVIEVQNTPNPANPNATPHVMIEQYNPLPPN